MAVGIKVNPDCQNLGEMDSNSEAEGVLPRLQVVADPSFSLSMLQAQHCQIKEELWIFSFSTPKRHRHSLCRQGMQTLGKSGRAEEASRDDAV